MVKICANTYSSKNEEEFQQHFEKYPFELSTFQKYGIEAIVKGHHVLITAHTGSGKTLPAEFAIEHMVKKGKKVIYTAPIKALSNQKFYEFTKKYPHISFGILTGDIKTNPEADVLIMTTEILLNTLYNKQSKSVTNTSIIDFDMDFDNELGCVIFDEVHYINDPDRGRVWEESIMMMPEHVQMVMLSATIDTPEKFAEWCETRGNTPSFKSDKFVYLASTNHRVVPLTHYAYLTTNSGVFKTIKDKETQKEIKDVTDKLLPIQSNLGHFSEPNFNKIKKTIDLFSKHRLRMNRQHVLNKVCKHMVDNQMLPALCFVLSRKQLEVCANEITVNLLEFDSKVPYIVKNECEQIIRKLPNYEEYLHLPEYVNMVALLEKGIAIHHSGVMPVIKEMVELLYAKGYIKILFATETFSIGVNMPTKTVLFTSSSKFDGNVQRTLYSHEYTQMAGRAGRRGIDKVGHVIHLSNLFPKLDCITYKKMMHGKPQSLTSKFKISFNLLLNLIDIGDTDFVHYAKRSMIQNDIEKEISLLNSDIQKAKNNLLTSTKYMSPPHIIEQYIELTTNINTLKSKKRKEAEKQIHDILNEFKYIKNDVANKHSISLIQKDIDEKKSRIKDVELFMNNNIDGVIDILEINGFVEKTTSEFELENTPSTWTLTTKGKIASCIKEVHCLTFADIIDQQLLYSMTAIQLVGVFSCFTNVTVSDEIRRLSPDCDDTNVNNIMDKFKELYDNYKSEEDRQFLSTGLDCEYHYDLMNECMKWCHCNDVTQCKQLLQNMEYDKEVFLGEFVKALMKINNIASEMEKIAEIEGRMDFLSVLREIPRLTMKYVVTNQSLYI